MLFSFGGASTFPTIQTDMEKSSRFPLSVFWAYVGVISMYLPVSVLAFVAYGKDITSNILNSVGHNEHNASSLTLDIVIALITLHLLFSFVIVINPVSQQFEELLSIPQREYPWQPFTVMRVRLELPRLNVAMTRGPCPS